MEIHTPSFAMKSLKLFIRLGIWSNLSVSIAKYTFVNCWEKDMWFDNIITDSQAIGDDADWDNFLLVLDIINLVLAIFDGKFHAVRSCLNLNSSLAICLPEWWKIKMCFEERRKPDFFFLSIHPSFSRRKWISFSSPFSMIFKVIITWSESLFSFKAKFFLLFLPFSW